MFLCIHVAKPATKRTLLTLETMCNENVADLSLRTMFSFFIILLILTKLKIHHFQDDTGFVALDV